MRSWMIGAGWGALLLLGCETQQAEAAPARLERFEVPERSELPRFGAESSLDEAAPRDVPASDHPDTPEVILPPDVVAREGETPAQALDRALAPAARPAGDRPGAKP